MKKTEKFTQIYFNEGDPLMEISTWNTNLKHRLGRYAADHPDFCRIVETDGGCMRFLIDKLDVIRLVIGEDTSRDGLK